MDDIANYALDALKKAGADKASCHVSKGRNDEFNVEENKFTLLRTTFNDGLNIKALVGGRKGVMVVNKLDKNSIDEAVNNCIALAKSGTPDEAEDIAPLAENKTFDQTIGGADMSKLFSHTKEYLAELKEKYPKIVLNSMSSQFHSGEWQYVNSNGVNFSAKHENYSFHNMFVAKDGEKSSSFNGGGASLKDLKTPFMDTGIHRQALDESVKSLNPRMVDGKFTGKVIFTPTCPDPIWYTILGCFIGDGVLIEGTSRWADALGTTVADPRITMRSTVSHPSLVWGEAITGDGFLSQDNDFIKDGILKSFALGLYGANKTGKPRSANTAHYNLEILPGDTTLADMIKGIDKGILLNRFSGGQPGPSGDVSGVAKNSFLIENGQITDAIQETMLSFNVTDVLKNLVSISKETITDGHSILPWCCFDGITVSGK